MAVRFFRSPASAGRVTRRFWNSERRCTTAGDGLAAPRSDESDAPKIRNIGIVAHVDAGKTTVTERILFYSGLTRSMGEVHDGDTVTDCLPQERERGISITAATVTFPWRGHRINLVDTPGHVDFSVEVERSLRVLDGAVAVLDGSEGVQAQTLSVWEQANRHRLPRLVFVNKMDKPAADLDACVADVRSKLSSSPLVLQLPVRTDDKWFAGVVDLASLEMLLWPSDSQRGRIFSRAPIAAGSELHARALRHRQALAEAIAEVDDVFADEFLLRDKSPTGSELLSAVRRVCVACAAVPVLCGSAYRNTAVQPLLDAVVDFLPGPLVADDRKDRLAALAFKVVHSKVETPLFLATLFTERKTKNNSLHDIVTQNSIEVSKHVMRLTCDVRRDVALILPTGGRRHRLGRLAGLHGLLWVHRGTRAHSEDRGPGCSRVARLHELLWQTAAKWPALPQQKQDARVAGHLARGWRLRRQKQQDVGLTVLGGLGRLHLEITRDRIMREYGVDVSLGQLQVAYREAPTKRDAAPVRHILDRTTGGTRNHVELEMRVVPAEGPFHELQVYCFWDKTQASRQREHARVLPRGVHTPYGNFISVSYTVRLRLTCKYAAAYTTDTQPYAAHTQPYTAHTQPDPAHTRLYAAQTVCTPEDYLGRVLSDLSRRRAAIGEVQQRRNVRVVSAKAPLAELDDYADELRTLCSGRASFHMALDSYRPMGTQDTAHALRQIAGLADDA
ncbi:unnamed protein product [Ixodes hexagonus]